MYSIRDIIKKSFLEGYSSSDISIKTVIIALAITAIIGFYIFMLYRVMCRKTFYSKTFNISLVGVALITTAIIITIQSSIVVSLGMVGALSIVRFRTAVKEPMDLMFLFWSISTGIMCGAGFAEFAIALALILTLVVAVLNLMPVAKAPLILIVNADNIDSEKNILDAVKEYAPHFQVKARNMTADSLDMTIEVRSKQGSELVRKVMSVEGVKGASLLAHDGEVTF